MFHRGDLLGVLAEAVQGLKTDVVTLDKRCITVEQTTDHAEVRFADGDVRKFPFVIGADGIHSKVRASRSAPIGLNSPDAWHGAAWCRWTACRLASRGS